MKVIPNSYHEWKLLNSYNFHAKLHPRKKVSKVKLEGVTL
jgi:hypothetical protein